MRGIAFTIEAIFTVLLIIVFASYFVVSNNPPSHMLFYKTLAMDVADRAVSEDFWNANEDLQQQFVDNWGLKTSLCVKITQNNRVIYSENCGPLNDTYTITSARVYFENNALKGVNSFIVGISPPG